MFNIERSKWFKWVFIINLVILVLSIFLPIFNKAINLVLGLGLLFWLLITSFILIKTPRKKDLVGNGIRIKAKITQVLTGRSPQDPVYIKRLFHLYYIKAQFRHAKSKHKQTFSSWSFFCPVDPTPFLPKHITVWIDPKKKTNYFVDLDTLPDDIARNYFFKG